MSAPSFDLDALRRIVSRFGGRRIAVLGDCMLDRYLWGRAERISPEAPVPVVEIERETFSLGGAGNVAVNLAALGALPLMISVTGADPEGERVRAELVERGVHVEGIAVDRSRPTTVKTRIVAHSQQVVRADFESREEVAGDPLARMIGSLTGELPRCEALVVSDYGKGAVHPGTLEAALGAARQRGIPVCVDPKERHLDAYRGVTILTPNQHEAGWAQGRRVTDEASLLEVGWALRERLDAGAVLITLGPRGMSLFERGGRHTHLPTVAREVFDVTGAGDTVVSVVALALAAGADPASAARLANHAAGIVIREVGTAACTPAQLLESLESAWRDEGGVAVERGADRPPLEPAQADQIAAWRRQGRRIVFTNGVFDLLHLGHVDYLEKARALGDRLVVGLNSDASVRRLKGPMRPVVGEHERRRMVESLGFVDLVVVFDDPTPERLIRELRPDVLAKGADWAPDQIVGREFVESYGGRVERVALIPGVSTSGRIRRIREGKSAADD